MKDSTHIIIIDSKLTAKDIRDSLWRCRDFELSHFWQRSIFLLTMMSIFIAAYGHIVMKLCDEVSKYCEECINNVVFVYNNIAIILCIINSLFSVLWIMMAKGSKAWYEKYEAAIEAIENDVSFINNELIVDTAKCKKIGGFRFFNLKNYKNPNTINCIFSTAGGTYSPSRINIFIGQVAAILWTCTLIFHIVLPFIMYHIYDWLLKYGMLIIVGVIFVIFYLKYKHICISSLINKCDYKKCQKFNKKELFIVKSQSLGENNYETTL